MTTIIIFMLVMWGLGSTLLAYYYAQQGGSRKDQNGMRLALRDIFEKRNRG